MQAKSKIDAAQLRDKLERGAKEIEIHTDSHILPTEKQITEARTLLNEYDAKIVAIHLPIIDKRATTITDILNNPEELIRWAIHVPLLTDGECSIVVHNDIKIDMPLNVLFSRGTRHLHHLLKNNPKLSIDIENSMQMVHPVTLADTAELITWLRGNISPNFNGLLDTCHMYSDMFESNQPGYPADLHAFLPLTKRIHLSDCKGDGMLSNQHGRIFESQLKLNDILDHIYSINPNTKYCFEVQEEDYTSSNNYSAMCDMFTQYKTKETRQCN